MGNLIRRVLGRASALLVFKHRSAERRGEEPVASGRGAPPISRVCNQEQPSAETTQRLEAWLAASEAGLLEPPADVHSAVVWDEYWRNHLKVGALEQGFADRMASDPTLPGLLAERGARTILCAGNGLSFEAISLALLGFDVTALDISVVPAEAFESMVREAEHPIHRIPGFELRDDGSLVFGTAGPIDPALCPPMHQSDTFPPRGGGSLSFVTGDLMNPEICPGPFDVVVERRTVQLFPESERISALERLVARLSSRCVLVSQQHEGGWRPGDDRTHYAESWLSSRGFQIESGVPSRKPGVAARLARLEFSSG